MALVKAPLFGLDASGALGGSIVFSKWRGRNYVRILTIPANPRSGLQVGMREVFKYITQAWAAIGSTLQAEWELEALADNITGLNAQVRTCQRLARRNLGWVKGPSEAAGTTPDAPTALTTTAQPKTLVLGWTRPVGNQGDYTSAVYMSITGAFTEDISNLVAIVAVATVTVTIINLTTGVEQFWSVREMNTDGEFGAASAEGSGTPT